MRSTVRCILTLVTLALSLPLITGTAQSAIMLAEYAEDHTATRVQLSADGVTPTGSSISTDAVNESGPLPWALFDASTGGNRYTRMVLDMRIASLSRQDVRSGGTGWDIYNPASGSDDFQTALGGFSGTLQGSTIASMSNGSEVSENGWTAFSTDSFGVQTLNWLMIKPDDASGSTLPGAYIALGFAWDDQGTLGTLDSGDTVRLLHGVYADTFAEIDTVAELNAAVGNVPPEVVPEPSSLVLLSLAGCAIMGRRRHGRRRVSKV